MELGQRLKQARLEMGLSQRQLCGDVITRNMLSLIENGSAKPSMETLCYLAGKLEKPVSFFLEEQTPVPRNQQLLLQARQAKGTEVLQILEDYQSPDPVFDPERWLMEALTCLALARQAIGEKKNTYALSLLHRAGEAGEKTPYYTRETERARLLLCFRAGEAVPVQALPDIEPELLLRAKAALDGGNGEQAARLLDAAGASTPYWHFLRASAWELCGSYEKAAEHYLQAEAWEPMQVYRCLERCYRAMEDYKRAYEYACKQR